MNDKFKADHFVIPEESLIDYSASPETPEMGSMKHLLLLSLDEVIAHQMFEFRQRFGSCHIESEVRNATK